ncbi:MAG TPA: glycosyltransferase family 39 protein, partial [Chloroflexota bacterium]|nr:glycosyltransferase family 39 protein [Chloroflexota bacterium]
DARPRLAATAEFLRDYPEPFRVRGISETVFPSDYGSMVGLPTIGGDTPFLDQRMDEMLKADADWRVWQILNVKFFLSDGPALAGMKLAFQDGNLKTYAVEDSLPRAWAVRAVEVAKSPAEARQMILAPGYHPGNIVVLEKPPVLGPFLAGRRPDVKITHLDPQRIEIEASGDGNAMLVLADRYDADWVAYRDGVPVPTYQANYLATAMELPSGQHHFILVYRPTAFYGGAAVSLLTLLLLAAYALVDQRVRRRFARLRVGFRVQRWLWAGLAAILLVGGFALRLHGLGQPTLTNDEWFMLRNHDEGPLWIIHQAHTFEPHPLLYYLGLAGWIELAGRSEFAMRFPSAAFGVLLIAATLGLARQLIGRRGALLAGLLVTLNPYLVAESQNARNYAMVCALGAVATLLFWHALKGGKSADWIAYAIAMFLALNTHLDAALVFAAHFGFVGIRAVSGGWLSGCRRSRLRLHRGILAAGAVGALFVLWLLWAWPALLAYHGYFPEPVTVPQVIGRTLATFSLGAASSARRALPFIALGALGIGWLSLRRRDHALFLAIAILVPFGLVAILFTRRPMFDERYLIVLAPVFLISVAAGIEGLLRRLTPLGGLGLVGALVLLAPTIPNVYSAQLTDRGDYRSMAAWISTYGRPDDVIVATGHGQAELFGYYYHGPETVKVIDDPALLAAQLPDLARDHGVWLLPYWQSPADGAALAALSTNAAPVAEQWFVNTRALYFASLDTLAPVTATGSFDGSLSLKAAALDEGAVHPGDAVATRLDWNVAKPLSDGKLSLRLLDNQGSVVAQHDLSLADGVLPIGPAQSRTGLFVPATAPPGRYQLAALVYHGDSGAAFKLATEVPHQGDLLLLGGVTVEPRERPVLYPNDGIPRTVTTTFSPGVSLLGHTDLDGTASVGERRDIALLWQSNRKLSADVPRVVEFLNAAGAVVAATSGPILPEYPTSRWQPGVPISEHLGIVIPVALPSGSYTVRLTIGGQSIPLGTIGVSSPTRVMAAPPVGQSVGVPIGSFATLFGVTAPRSEVTGNNLNLKVVWQARGTADRSYTVFVHLLDPTGKIVAQVDQAPGNGQRPTTTWAPGEFVEDTYTLAIPTDAPAGPYTIEVGLYDQQSGQRLPITLASGTTADHLVIARVAVAAP